MMHNKYDVNHKHYNHSKTNYWFKCLTLVLKIHWNDT